jgi:chlorite dismutase
MRRRIGRILISLLIAASGWWGAGVLVMVDEDIRVIYADYTLAVTDLGHMNTRVIRYRSTILRAIEADTQQQFERIASSLPLQQQRIEETLDRYMKASRMTHSNSTVKAQETAAIMESREKLSQYIDASRHTLNILKELWMTSSPEERRRIRDQAERHASQNAGPKLIAASFALDDLIDIVVSVARDAKKDADAHLRIVTAGVMAICFGLAMLVLAFPVFSA